jgi:hypothetical protein
VMVKLHFFDRLITVYQNCTPSLNQT